MNVCPECGGKVVPTRKPGRTMRYRGAEYRIPANYVIPTCKKCGAQWTSTEQLLELGAWLEKKNG
jgi:hypothetical protein